MEEMERIVGHHFYNMPRRIQKVRGAQRTIDLLTKHVNQLVEHGKIPKELSFSVKKKEIIPGEGRIPKKYQTHTFVRVSATPENIKITNLPQGMDVATAKALAVDAVGTEPQFTFAIKGKARNDAIHKAANKRFYKFDLIGGGGEAKRFTHEGVRFHVGALAIENKKQPRIKLMHEPGFDALAVKAFLAQGKHSPHVIAEALAKRIVQHDSPTMRAAALEKIVAELTLITKV